MLEAFKASGAAHKPSERSETVAAPPAAPSTAPAKPAAPSSTRPPTSSAAPKTNAPPRAAQRASDPLALARSPLVRLAALQVVLLAAAFFIGRWSARAFGGADNTARAQEANPDVERVLQPTTNPVVVQPPAQSNPSAPAAPLQARPEKPTPADLALFDAKNKFTVKTIEYGDSFADLAKRTYDYLVKRGYPVAQPYVAGKKIHILIGAAATSGELEKLMYEIRALPDPDGRKGFETALITPIDRIVKRN